MADWPAYNVTVDTEQQRKFLRYVIKRMKELHHEWTAYRALVQVMQDEGFPAERVAAILEGARKPEEGPRRRQINGSQVSTN